MTHCPACGAATESAWNFCAACGATLGPAAAARPVHLDDVLYNCQRCGKEARYAELPRCEVCKEPMCGDCVAPCAEHGGLACRSDLVECSACKKIGCANCYETCETCRVSGLCPDHNFACEDCGYPTCERCMGECRKCGLEICNFCVEAHKAEKR